MTSEVNEKLYLCWYCNGSGKWYRVTEQPAMGGRILFAPCPECDGKKFLPESKMSNIVLNIGIAEYTGVEHED
jgi:hypothetical protein